MSEANLSDPRLSLTSGVSIGEVYSNIGFGSVGDNYLPTAALAASRAAEASVSAALSSSPVKGSSKLFCI